VTQSHLAELYASADAFVMPSLYEGYGMALGEAMARGLAIVCTTGGAAAETVPDGAALKVAPGDVPALSAALERVLTDQALRGRLADAAWAAGQRLPRWEEAARRIAAAIIAITRAERLGERS
jgi:glycosyltransferase involved in cell wall biosynthesis